MLILEKHFRCRKTRVNDMMIKLIRKISHVSTQASTKFE